MTPYDYGKWICSSCQRWAEKDTGTELPDTSRICDSCKELLDVLTGNPYLVIGESFTRDMLKDAITRLGMINNIIARREALARLRERSEWLDTCDKALARLRGEKESGG